MRETTRPIDAGPEVIFLKKLAMIRLSPRFVAIGLIAFITSTLGEEWEDSSVEAFDCDTHTLPIQALGRR